MNKNITLKKYFDYVKTTANKQQSNNFKLS
jgi:hypothetical protein